MDLVPADGQGQTEVESFLARAAGDLGLRALDQLDDLAFFVKDRERRFVYCNKAFVTLMRQEDMVAILGRTDDDFSPEYLVEAYKNDDNAVLATGGRLDEIVELVRKRDGSYSWNTTTKFPIFDTDGSILGVGGFTRLLTDRKLATQRFLGLDPAIEFIMRNFQRPIRTANMAETVFLSSSQFIRRFHQRFGVSPHNYVRRVRLNAACDLLATTGLSASSIASRTGFYDQSHMTNEFVKQRDMTPGQYRKRYQSQADQSSDLDLTLRVQPHGQASN